MAGAYYALLAVVPTTLRNEASTLIERSEQWRKRNDDSKENDYE